MTSINTRLINLEDDEILQSIERDIERKEYQNALDGLSIDDFCDLSDILFNLFYGFEDKRPFPPALLDFIRKEPPKPTPLDFARKPSKEMWHWYSWHNARTDTDSASMMLGNALVCLRPRKPLWSVPIDQIKDQIAAKADRVLAADLLTRFGGLIDYLLSGDEDDASVLDFILRRNEGIEPGPELTEGDQAYQGKLLAQCEILMRFGDLWEGIWDRHAIGEKAAMMGFEELAAVAADQDRHKQFTKVAIEHSHERRSLTSDELQATAYGRPDLLNHQ